MKKLKHIISWTIWGLLALYVSLVILIQLPFMQRWLGQIVASAIGNKLGTEVSVGRVDLGFFNRLIIDDVVIKDQQHEDMLAARRMSVKVELLPLFSGRVSISSAQLFGANAVLYRDSAGATPNWQFAIDALSKKEKEEPSKLDLHIGSLIVRRLSLTYDQRDAPETPGRLNPRHLKVSDISAHVLLRTLTNDSLNASIKRIALHEQSGIDLQRLSLKLEANRQQALLTGFALEMQNTSLSIDTVQATYVLDSLANTIAYHVPVIKGRVALSDLVAVLPENLSTDYDVLVDVSSLSGSTNSVNCRQLSISTTNGALQLLASGRVDSREGTFQTHVERFSVNSHLLAELQEVLSNLPSAIGRLGDVSISADAATDDFGDIRTQGRASTSIGTLSWRGTMTDDARQWSAHIDTDSLDIGRLTANNELGLLAASLDLSGRQQRVSILGDIPTVDLHGYRYHNISVDAVYSPEATSGKLKVDDPNLQADVEGSWGQHLQLTGVIGMLAPKALHLSDRWGDATFSAVIDADINGSSFNSAQGTIDLDDLLMAQNDTTHYHLDNLHIRSGYEDERRYMRMTSDFGEVLFTGHSNGTFSLPPFGQIGHAKEGADNDFELSARLSDSRWMEKLLGIALDLQGPLMVEALVNDAEERMLVKADIPSFRYGNADYRNGNILLTRQGDSTSCDIRVTRLTAKGNPIHLSMITNAKEKEASSALSLFNESGDGGTVNMVTSLYQNDEGVNEIHVRVMPSRFVLKDNLWDLEPCDILYSDKRLMIDHFTLHHDDEHLIIDGIASTNAADSLMIDLQGVDVAYVQEAVGFRSVRFGGRATGRAYVCQAFSNPDAWADITVDDFLFQEAHMGTLEAFAVWNFEDGQIDLEGVIDDGAEAQTFVDGYISPRRKELDLGIQAQGTNIGFVHSFTRSFIGSIEGKAYGDVRIYGPLKAIDMVGNVAVNGKASVRPLGTTYSFANDTVRLRPGDVIFTDFIVTDRDGHQGTLNGDVTFTHFKNIQFDLRAEASQLLAYDFPQMDAGGIIGGTVWANGQAVMKGRPGEVTIDCDVTPTPGSFFIYNASSPDAINRQQFITWSEGEEVKGERLPQTSNNSHTSRPIPLTSNTADIHLNLRINTTPDATLRLLMDQNSGDIINLNGSGTLRASYYNKGAFQMFGTYNIERGSYSMTIQNLLKKNFQFQQGSTMVFNGDPYGATLNWKAVHTVNGVSLSDLGLGNQFTSNTIRVNCLMNIVGTAGEPRVEFDLEMPTVNSEEEQMIRSIMASEQELNQQVVYLLGIGRFYTQGANNANVQGYGQTELAMQSLLSGTVSSQINQLLSQVIKNDDWNFGANISTGNEGWHNAEYEGLVSGRMLNNRLLLNGQFGYRDNATQASPSFIGDFDIQYLLTPGGSLALKAYNQTNDRYFTHSSLNTQGVGLIMKKDFSGLRDLFTIRKKTKTKAKTKTASDGSPVGTTNEKLKQ
ncbi:MAG: translocation/assembly module TamB domain-containing protein [Prevotella sp.]|nr:translocation/assembly module TamB domain-containing protein [Prevotella sp.]